MIRRRGELSMIARREGITASTELGCLFVAPNSHGGRLALGRLLTH
jgi:hypothetical protein